MGARRRTSCRRPRVAPFLVSLAATAVTAHAAVAGVGSILRGGHRSRSASLLEEQDQETRRLNALFERHSVANRAANRAMTFGLPPELAMYETTTMAPLPLGPNPYLFWVEAKPSPLPTTPPPFEQCYGCNCLIAEPGNFLTGGLISDQFTCNAAGPALRVPEISWMGSPGDTIPGKSCPTCQSLALTVEDLDFPGGIGETGNTIGGIFWAVNIPGDWKEFTQAKAMALGQDGTPAVTMMTGSDGQAGMPPICPAKGEHRYKITLWALSAQMGNDLSPIDPRAEFSTIVGEIEGMELARVTFFAKYKAPGGYHAAL